MTPICNHILLKLKWLSSQGGSARKGVFSLAIFDCHIYPNTIKCVERLSYYGPVAQLIRADGS